MKIFSLSAILLAATLSLTGCEKKPDPTPVTEPVGSTAISVSIDGAPPYKMKNVQIGLALYQSSRANLELSGKTDDTNQISLKFRQSSTTVGANRTDLVDATLNGTTAATQTTGTTVRDATTNTVSGSFSCQFANGMKVDGTISGLQL